ncbi:MAG: polysaccharide pyruvyl transferase family protein [Burkholderiaceae bacterium]|nr:polysaccharide pyruvyl transferase family protein [Burkholderiaceae bacterium]
MHALLLSACTSSACNFSHLRHCRRAFGSFDQDGSPLLSLESLAKPALNSQHAMPLEYLKQLRRRFFAWRDISALIRQLAHHVRGMPEPSESMALRRLLILPSDPWTLVGAKGDEAMMQAVVGRLRQYSSDLQVGVITATPVAHAAAGQLGFVSVPAWDCSLGEVASQIEAFHPDAMVVLGADVLDGYYNPVTTSRMLLMADAAARHGVRVSILGFSFNNRPNSLVKPVFEGLSKRMAINVRDRVSFDRFRAFCNAPCRLVADSAFMLEADFSGDTVQAVERWSTSRRAAGDVILGFNMHPMLFRHASSAQINALVGSAVSALRAVAQRRRVSVLLLSHDYRGHDGDDVCLAPIALALADELGPQLNYPTTQFSAAQLKAMASFTDGVVTGRMHLAIATLGMGRPVAALTYQDKFQGLFAHFEYPERFLLTPAAAAQASSLTAMVEEFVDRLPELTKCVRDHLPAVREASFLNLERVLPSNAVA